MSATAVVFPFDTFGNAGTGDGARLLGDVLREVVSDAEQETLQTRQDAFAADLRVEEVPFDTMTELAGWRAAGRAVAREQLADGGFLLWLAGNHLGVLPVYEELGPRTLVVQLDAHLDCYNLYDCTDTLSHGNWLLHAETPLPRVANVGHRDLFLHPGAVAERFALAVPADAFALDPAKAVARLRRLASKADRVWLDIDVDVFDPTVCPAVHQPTPFGLSGQQVLGLISGVWSPKLAGVSVSEFDPGRDARDASLNLLGWLLEWLLLRQSGG